MTRLFAGTIVDDIDGTTSDNLNDNGTPPNGWTNVVLTTTVDDTGDFVQSVLDISPVNIAPLQQMPQTWQPIPAINAINAIPISVTPPLGPPDPKV